MFGSSTKNLLQEQITSLQRINAELSHTNGKQEAQLEAAERDLRTTKINLAKLEHRHLEDTESFNRQIAEMRDYIAAFGISLKQLPTGDNAVFFQRGLEHAAQHVRTLIRNHPLAPIEDGDASTPPSEETLRRRAYLRMSAEMFLPETPKDVERPRDQSPE